MLGFILGILFAQFILPTLDSFCSLLLTWIESIKGKISITITECNRKVIEINDSPISKNKIGFSLPDEEEDGV